MTINWLPSFEKEVFKILTSEYKYTDSEAIESLECYNSVFSLIDMYTEPFHVAWRINSDRVTGTPPFHYIETLSIIHDASHMLAQDMKIPEPENVNKEYEFCIKCNYPKYKNEQCKFCK
ncbi:MULTISPECIES: hypothetical protein [Paenibacillus]|jgi:hypothetical protein|uniref:hypothetical protein n=1 Tax=Paenibacillus TaxID=44249 RepID=UPI00096FADE3|nr:MULTISPECIES: hypothetical protein [Paenibacillus]MBP1177422.1 hypothetical protein [Paenibacillus sp. PvR133]OMF34758.1 hypothetical protein BK134_05745 [Paenibacillus peoriae]